MPSKEFLDYLGRLMGRSVAPDEWVKLSSGQQARVAGWLAERGIAPPNLRARLGAQFQAHELFEGGDGGTPLGRSATDLPSSPPPGVARAGLRIGIDIQSIEELIPAEAAADPKASAELTGIFTAREISYAQSRPAPMETLGGLFAAKEALRKCDAGLLARSLLEVEVLPDASGRPEFAGFELSISHSGGFAIAVAVTASPTPPEVRPLPPELPAGPAQHPEPKAPAGRGFIVGIIAVAGGALALVLALLLLGVLRLGG